MTKELMTVDLPDYLTNIVLEVQKDHPKAHILHAVVVLDLLTPDENGEGESRGILTFSAPVDHEACCAGLLVTATPMVLEEGHTVQPEKSEHRKNSN